MNYNDDAVCLQSGIYRIMQEDVSEAPELFDFKLIPNPASQQITVDLKFANDEAVHFEIRNLLGGIIKEFVIDKGLKSIVFSINNFEQGIYFVRVRKRGSNTECEKIGNYKMKNYIVIILLFASNLAFGQGYNHNYLVGYDFAYPPWGIYSDKGIIKVDTANFYVIGLSRKMKFRGAQANIANANGDLLFYTNGCWIANALEDTMPNGNGIATDLVDSQWCSTAGIQWIQSSLILPLPDDSSRYLLFHHGNSYANPPYNLPLTSFYSVIDMNLDSGRGDVVAGQKKITLIQDTILPGFAACKHANGKDWWVVILKGYSNLIYKILLTSQGVTNVSIHNIGLIHTINEAQKCFSLTDLSLHTDINLVHLGILIMK